MQYPRLMIAIFMIISPLFAKILQAKKCNPYTSEYYAYNNQYGTYEKKT